MYFIQSCYMNVIVMVKWLTDCALKIRHIKFRFIINGAFCWNENNV